jgi:hypothetical protein
VEIAFIILCGITIIYAIYIGINEEEKRKKEYIKHQEEQRANEQRRLQQEQNDYKIDILNLCHMTMGTYEKLAQTLEAAENNLNQAMVDLNERAYAPFWNSIEKATKHLAIYDESVRFIKQSINNYISLSAYYDGASPEYPLSAKSLQKLDVATGTSKKLDEIVRIAQRDFEFSTIYEQRKTNQILVAGFTNLADAIDRMTYQIIGSISDMETTLNSSMNAIEASISSGISGLDKSIQSQHEQSMGEYRKVSTENAKRQEKVLERLDNIQRGRKPLRYKR